MKCQFPILTILLLIPYISCKEYLDENTDEKKEIPSKVADLQALLDDAQALNQRSLRVMDLSADEYYLTDNDWATLEEHEKRTYTWAKSQLFEKGNKNDWVYAYTNVNILNTVLAYADKVKGTPEEISNVKGQALCLRAQVFLQVAFSWTKVYSAHTADTDLGIPLKSTSDMNEKLFRSTLRQTYSQIINDLKLAAELLPVQPVHAVRASKPGAYALLARAYMAIQDYKNMGVYADLCLHFKNTLVDYNALNDAIQFPFAPIYSNAEIISASNMAATKALNLNRAKINPELYNLFDDNDLRKKIFFRNNNNGTFGFRGNYSGTSFPFSGIATDEVYLMRAEAYARDGKTDSAMKDLNTLLEERFVVNTFVPITAQNQEEALKKVLDERRKELILRGLRWIDLKRLNKEGADIELKRQLNGHIYILPPNDLRYALPIPEDEIKTYNMQQNPV